MIGVLVVATGAMLLLSGCSSHTDNKKRGKSETITTAEKKEIKAEVQQKDVKWIVQGALVVCSNAQMQGPSKSKMKITDSNLHTQGQSELCYSDVEFEPLFDKCEINGACDPVIEDNKWQSYDPGKIVAGKNGMLKDEAYMICTYGCGLIYATNDGQIVGKMELQGAYRAMNRWLQGNTSNDKILEMALKDAAKYGPQTSVSLLPPHDKGQYDTSILAWTNYWNHLLEEKYGQGNYTPVRPTVVKAMMGQESTFGTAPTMNATRNIMQSMVPGDPCYWAALNKDPTAPGKSHYGQNEYVINITDLNGNIRSASMCQSNPSSAERDWFDNGSWKVLDSTLTTDANGEYHCHYDKVTPDMSLAVGIGWLSYKMNQERGKLSEEDGVKNYNGGGDPQYVSHINNYMGQMNDQLKQ